MHLNPERAAAQVRNGVHQEVVFDVLRDHTPSIASIGDAVRSDALSHPSVHAILSGGEVVWDPKAYRIQTPEALNSEMQQEVRGSWSQS